MLRKIAASFVLVTFCFLSAFRAGAVQSLDHPQPGMMPTSSAPYTPQMIYGLTIHPDNPLLFDFIIQPGDERLEGPAFEAEAAELIQYFFTAMTVPENQMWVNLSPYESNRIIPDSFGKTLMGQSLLAQDYQLKQLSASLLSPETETGQRYWHRIFKHDKTSGAAAGSAEQNTMDARMSAEFGEDWQTFHKVWIIPDKVKIYEQGNSVFVVGSHLKVMLESDYHALDNNQDGGGASSSAEQLDQNLISEQALCDIILPEIEREVNTGETFAPLRQTFQSAILAAWYKQNLRDSLLGRLYVNRQKTAGIESGDHAANQAIYEQYLKIFAEGVHQVVQEEYDPFTQDITPRNYFSGGVDYAMLGDNLEATLETGLGTGRDRAGAVHVTTFLQAQNDSDRAMLGLSPEDQAEVFKLRTELRRVQEDIGNLEKRRLTEGSDGIVSGGVMINWELEIYQQRLQEARIISLLGLYDHDVAREAISEFLIQAEEVWQLEIAHQALSHLIFSRQGDEDKLDRLLRQHEAVYSTRPNFSILSRIVDMPDISEKYHQEARLIARLGVFRDQRVKKILKTYLQDAILPWQITLGQSMLSKFNTDMDAEAFNEIDNELRRIRRLMNLFNVFKGLKRDFLEIAEARLIVRLGHTRDKKAEEIVRNYMINAGSQWQVLVGQMSYYMIAGEGPYFDTQKVVDRIHQQIAENREKYRTRQDKPMRKRDLIILANMVQLGVSEDAQLAAAKLKGLMPKALTAHELMVQQRALYHTVSHLADAPSTTGSSTDAQTVPEQDAQPADPRPSPDSAMMAENLGGIDLNPQYMEFERDGRPIEFTLPVHFTESDLHMFQGFTPVILQIKPALHMP